MSNINSFYPPSGGGSANASVGPNGTTAPTSSTEIGFIDGSGNEQGVSATNPLPVTLQSGTAIIGTVAIDQTTPGTTNGVVVNASALPTGAATQTTLTTVSTTLGSILLDLTNGTQITQITGTVPLPTGAATAANQTNATQKTQIVDGSGNVIASTSNALNVSTTSSALPTGASTAALQSNVQSAPGTPQTIALTVQGNASGVALPISAAALPLPTGAATSALQTTGNTSLATIATNTGSTVTNQTNGTQTSRLTDGTNTAAVKASSTAPVATDPALVVAVSPNSPAPKGTAGRSLANAPTVTTYATPITSAGYTTIIASTTSATNLVELFDSSGVALFFATGAAASEVNQFVIYPGGNGAVSLSIPAGSRISYKAVSASATGSTAYNVLNLYT